MAPESDLLADQSTPVLSHDHADQAQKVFMTVKPVCTRVMNNFAYQNTEDLCVSLTELTAQVPSLSPSGLVLCAEYMFLPLFRVIDSYRPGEPYKVLERVLECVEAFTKRIAAPTKAPTGFGLLNRLSALLAVLPLKEIARSELSSAEQCHCLIMSCLENMLETLQQDPDSLGLHQNEAEQLHERLVEDKSRAFLGHLIFCILQDAEYTQNRQISIAAMHVLCSLSKFVRESAILAQFVPGMVSSLAKVCLGDFKIGSSLISTSTKAMAVILTLACGDAHTACLVRPGAVCETQTDDGKDPLTVLRQMLRSEKARELETSQKTSAIPSKARPETDSSAIITGAGSDVLLSPVNREWFFQADEKIDVVLRLMFKTLSHHSAPMVRLELCKLAGDVVTQCALTLPRCKLACLDLLCGYMSDDFEQISTTAYRQMHSFMAEMKPSQWINMLPDIEDRVMDAFKQLPGLVKTSVNESEIRDLLKRVCGYLFLMQGRLDIFFDKNLEAICGYLRNALLLQEIDAQVLETKQYRLDAPAPAVSQITADTSNERTVNAAVVGYYRKYFRFVREEGTVQMIHKLLSLITLFVEPFTMVERLLEPLQSVESYGETDFSALTVSRSKRGGAVESAYLLTELLSAFTSRGIDGLPLTKEACESLAHLRSPLSFSACLSLVDMVLDLPVWVDSNDGDEDVTAEGVPDLAITQRTVRRSDESNMVMALLLEGLGSLSTAAREEPLPVLVKLLYPLLERVGEDDVMVRQAAMSSLIRLSINAGASSIAELLEDNMDYILEGLTTRIRYMSAFPRTCRIVSAILRYSGKMTLPLIRDTVETLCHTLDDNWNSASCYDLLKGLLAILSALQAFPSSDVQKQITSEVDGKRGAKQGPTLQEQHEDGEESSDWFGRLVAELRVLAPVSLDDDDSTDPFRGTESDDDNSAAIGEAEEDSHPQKATLEDSLLPIADKVIYYVASADARVQVTSLRILSTLLSLIASKSDKLLPTIHKCWPALALRFSSTNRFVVIEALEVCRTMILLSGDFMGSRFANDAWPVMKSLLSQSFRAESNEFTDLRIVPHQRRKKGYFPDSIERTDISEANLTNSRVRLSVVRCLEAAAHFRTVIGANIVDIVTSCRPLAVQEVDKELRREVFVLYQQLYRLDGDSLFIFLASMANWNPASAKPPPSAEKLGLRYLSSARKIYDNPPYRCLTNASCQALALEILMQDLEMADESE